MSDVGRIGESFGGLEEAWSAKARLAALEARRRKRGTGGGLSAGLGDLEARLTGNRDLARSGVDEVGAAFRDTAPRSDKELFPGEAAYQARHAAHVSGTRRSYPVGDHTVHVHGDGTARVTRGDQTVFHGTEAKAHSYARRHSGDSTNLDNTPLTKGERDKYLMNVAGQGQELGARLLGKPLDARKVRARMNAANSDPVRRAQKGTELPRRFR